MPACKEYIMSKNYTAPEQLETTQKILLDRLDNAQKLAHKLSIGRPDRNGLDKLAQDYLDGVRPNAVREIMDEGDRMWANWMAEQAFALTDLIELERERPLALRAASLAGPNPIPLPAHMLRTRTQLVFQLAHDFKLVEASVHAIDPAREDLSQAFDRAMRDTPEKDYPHAFDSVNNARTHIIVRQEKKTRTQLNLLRAITRAAEVDMVRTWKVEKARRNLRGLRPYPAAQAKVILREQGRIAFMDLTRTQAIAAQTTRELMTYREMIAALDAPATADHKLQIN